MSTFRNIKKFLSGSLCMQCRWHVIISAMKCSRPVENGIKKLCLLSYASAGMKAINFAESPPHHERKMFNAKYIIASLNDTWKQYNLFDYL